MGSVGDTISIPDLPAGPYELVLESKSSIGSDRIVKNVAVQHPARIFLSSDKPIYQPGQTIHLRSLILNARTQKPFAGQEVTFEVKDPKGNKVFKESGRCSKFGIASVDFVLATELNLGRYGVCASAGATTAERAVEVKRYVLPKFKIELTTEHPYYLPGQRVSGTVQARYFFGRPVSGGTVKLEAATFQEKPVVITHIQGRTDGIGRFTFEFVLPDFLTGMPQKNEQAFLDLKAELRDSAQHVEEKTLFLSVARNELELSVLPESGAFVPGVENLLYVLTTYPDGRPAPCRIFIDGSAYQSDAQGVSTVKFSSSDANRALDIQAIDSAGRKARLAYRPDTNGPSPAFLLRTDKAVYQAGQSAQLSVLSAEKDNTVFIDVIKDAQTVLTKSVILKDHKASYTLALPASLAGTLKVNAYVITKNGEDKGCSRLICVDPASGLHIATRLSKPIYRPGEIAKLDFTITDAQGRPAPSALGISAVDESVFALQESRPELLQQFLDAEGELMKPRYQIKSFEFPGQFLSGTGANQALAQAYFASMDQPPATTGIDDLVKGRYIDIRTIEQARKMRGTPEYAKIRNDPQYSEIVRLLEGEQGAYSIREATGLTKEASVEANRKAYFHKLGDYVKSGILVLLFLSPILLLILEQLAAKGITAKVARTSVIEVLVIIGMIFLLASMLLPALAKAKQKAQRISFINDLKQIEIANRIAQEDGISPTPGSPVEPRVRRDFPETLLWRPELITDDQGKASLEIPLADSITTWRACVDGISAAGKMGSTEAPITVFQDFFVDLDLPVSMSLGDEVTVPVTCYNYLKKPQDILLKVTSADWFSSPNQSAQIHQCRLPAIAYL